MTDRPARRPTSKRSGGSTGALTILRVVPADDAELARTLLQIQHVAFAVEARLIRDERIPALHEDVEGLRAARLPWLAAFADCRLVGAVGWTENDEKLDVDRLVVTPDMHRHGVGSALVREVLQRAGKRHAVVSTGRNNVPAKTLYEHLGFVAVEDEEVIEGLWVTRYRRAAP